MLYFSVQSLRTSLVNEKKKLCDIQRCFDEEKRRNGDLITRISTQSRETAQIEIERDLLRRKSSSYEDRLKQFM